ncbi:MAG: TolC family protein, partial [Candidatus Pacebacteria bacterium]|nr:TolC family protein [Candidatus Paceibacterota bacterium]
VLDTLLEINVAYRRAQAAEQALRMMQTTLQSDRAAYDMAKRLREAGNITKLELKGRNAVLQQTKQALSQAELQLAERREALNRLMGLTTGELNWTMASPEG